MLNPFVVPYHACHHFMVLFQVERGENCVLLTSESMINAVFLHNELY